MFSLFHSCIHWNCHCVFWSYFFASVPLRFVFHVFSYFVTFVAGAMLSECFLSLDLKQKAFFRYHLKQKTCFRYHRSAPRILYNYCML